MQEEEAATRGPTGSGATDEGRPREMPGDRRRRCWRRWPSGCSRPPPRPTSASFPATKASRSPPPPKVEQPKRRSSGSHPYSVVRDANFESTGKDTDGDLKDMTLDLPPGPDRKPDRGAGMQRRGLLRRPRSSPFETTYSGESCPSTTQIGIDHPRRRPTPATKPGRSASSTSPRRRAFPRARLLPVRRADHGHPARARSRQRIRAHPRPQELHPAARRRRASKS